jgi:hypothetical protein
LNRLNTRYEEHKIKAKISHLLYIDDLKLLGKSEEELQKQIQTVADFSDDIRKEFGLESVQRLYLRKENLSTRKI